MLVKGAPDVVPFSTMSHICLAPSGSMLALSTIIDPEVVFRPCIMQTQINTLLTNMKRSPIEYCRHDSTICKYGTFSGRYCTITNILFNPLWSSDAIWQYRSWSLLAQAMVWCLKAPSHYLNQCWRIIDEDQWYSSECNFTRYLSHQLRKFVWKLFI